MTVTTIGQLIESPRGRLSLETHHSNLDTNLEPTAGFEPAARCLQIRQQLNSGPIFAFHLFGTHLLSAKNLLGWLQNWLQ